MIHGRFGDTTGRPYVEGIVAIPALGVRGAVSFLFDTGEDHTVLMPMDALRLGIDYSKLEKPYVSVGIGGKSVGLSNEAILIFSDPGIAIYTYQVDLIIKPNAKDIERIPSILGRNVINRWRLILHGEMKHLACEPLSYDHKFAIV